MKSQMKQKKKLLALLMLLAVSNDVFADMYLDRKNLSVTVGLRVWANEWQAWDDPYGVSSAAGSFGTANAIAVNPSVTVKYKNWFVSGGFMKPTAYKVPSSSTGTTISASRKEMDMSAGYYLHPQVALTVAYKRIQQTWGGTDYVWQIPAIGLSTFAPIQDTVMFIYGNTAVGYSKITTTGDATSYWGMKGGIYTTSEFGAGYSVSPAFRMTLGYKYQASPTSMESNLSPTRVNFVDYTRGVVLGGSFTF
jgi:predicted porin